MCKSASDRPWHTVSAAYALPMNIIVAHLSDPHPTLPLVFGLSQQLMWDSGSEELVGITEESMLSTASGPSPFCTCSSA